VVFHGPSPLLERDKNARSPCVEKDRREVVFLFALETGDVCFEG